MNQEKYRSSYDDLTREKILEQISTILSERYVFPEVAQKIIEKLTLSKDDGVFNQIHNASEFAGVLERIFQEMSNDKHLHIWYEPNKNKIKDITVNEEIPEEEKLALQQEKIEREKQSNFGFLTISILEGNIGYLDLRRFSHTDHAAKTAISSMNFLANTDAIIIDLRKNGGGEPEMVQLLASYFLNGRTQLNQIERRYEGVIEQFWTLPFVPGGKMVNHALYVLTSSRTFSAAEDFIYGLKCLDRITIIGEITKGGAHPADFFAIQDQIIMMVPTGKAINPKTNTNWEGVGIRPDISINSESAFDTAYVLALKNLIKNVENETEKRFLHLTLAEVKAQLSPEKVSNGVLQNYTGSYGIRKITLEGNQLYFQSRFFPKRKLIPITQTIFRFEGEDDIRIEFINKNDNGDMEIVFYYKQDREIITSKKD